MKQSRIYLNLCILGAFIPWYILVGFFGTENVSLPSFFISIFANNVASAVAADLIVSGLVFFAFVYFEGRRMGLKHLWIYVLATLLVGLSFGLPLFLYYRAKAIEQSVEL
ncbi:MAG: hypothetical protein A2X59_12620 [Nitrospirae bacterium GWC2_42_7]|nr:MAG: hypothetical protein A2X59_12620 [Nitrospirae bacterium GWC2_42_7]